MFSGSQELNDDGCYEGECLPWKQSFGSSQSRTVGSSIRRFLYGMRHGKGKHTYQGQVRLFAVLQILSSECVAAASNSLYTWFVSFWE